MLFALVLRVFFCCLVHPICVVCTQAAKFLKTTKKTKNKQNGIFSSEVSLFKHLYLPQPIVCLFVIQILFNTKPIILILRHESTYFLSFVARVGGHVCVTSVCLVEHKFSSYDEENLILVVVLIEFSSGYSFVL